MWSIDAVIASCQSRSISSQDFETSACSTEKELGVVSQSLIRPLARLIISELVRPVYTVPVIHYMHARSTIQTGDKLVGNSGVADLIEGNSVECEKKFLPSCTS
jgi:hypothetical protein